MKVKQRYYLAFLITLVSLSSCLVGKKYTKPEAPTDIAYHEMGVADTASLLNWFDLYQDTALQNIIATTLNNNKDFLTASARVEQARFQTAIVRANLFPQIDYSLEAGGGHTGTKAEEVGGGIEGGLFKVFGVLTWELDVWGRVRHGNRSAVAQFLAEVQNRNALQTSLVAEAASQYFLLRDLDNRLLIANQTLTGRRENTRIITDRFNKGYTAEIDQLQAQQQEFIVATTIPALKRQIVIVENSLRLLMGMGPGTVPRETANFNQAVAPAVPVGLPSQLLQRRPDILAAEKSLEAQFELVGVAQANRLPVISLTGILGFASPELSSLIDSKGAVANGFGNIFGPIFNFNQRKNIVELERKRVDELYHQYQKTVLAAFGDVDNALAFYRTYTEEYELRKAQVAAARKALDLSTARYDNGFTSYVEVILMQDNLFDAQLEESQALQGKLNAVVQLYRSLGGGW